MAKNLLLKDYKVIAGALQQATWEKDFAIPLLAVGTLPEIEKQLNIPFDHIYERVPANAEIALHRDFPNHVGLDKVLRQIALRQSKLNLSHRDTIGLINNIFLQAVGAVQQFHNQGFIHRDLKGENFKVKMPDWRNFAQWEESMELRLADFETAAYGIPELAVNHDIALEYGIGSPPYSPIEAYSLGDLSRVYASKRIEPWVTEENRPANHPNRDVYALPALFLEIAGGLLYGPSAFTNTRHLVTRDLDFSALPLAIKETIPADDFSYNKRNALLNACSFFALTQTTKH